MNLTRRGFCALSGVAAASRAGPRPCRLRRPGAPGRDEGRGAGRRGAQDYLTQGKGEHLVCGVTGKLIKIAPAIVADKLGYFDEEGCDVEFQQDRAQRRHDRAHQQPVDRTCSASCPPAPMCQQARRPTSSAGTILNGSEICALDSFDRELKTAADYNGLRIGR